MEIPEHISRVRNYSVYYYWAANSRQAITYLLLTEFEGRAVNYDPRFSPSIYESKGNNKGP